MINLLIVEDEDNIRLSLAESIESFIAPKFNIRLIYVENFIKAKELIIKDKIDIFILDYLLPDGDGIDLLKIIKERNPEAIVIFLTALEDYKLIALNLGADDYILKPFNLTEVIAKLNNWIKRIYTKYDNNLIHLVKNYYYDKLKANLLIKENQYYRLIDTLSYNEAIIFENLLNNINNFVILDESTADSYTIYSLRKKLEKLGLKLLTLKGKKVKLKFDN